MTHLFWVSRIAVMSLVAALQACNSAPPPQPVQRPAVPVLKRFISRHETEIAAHACEALSYIITADDVDLFQVAFKLPGMIFPILILVVAFFLDVREAC